MTTAKYHLFCVCWGSTEELRTFLKEGAVHAYAYTHKMMGKYPAIEAYRTEVKKIARVSTPSEGSIRVHFHTLLAKYAEKKDLTLVAEDTKNLPSGKSIRPDGTLFNSLKVQQGIWESKGPKSDLEKEIQKKFKKKYPKGNTLFENSKQAILYQGEEQVMQVAFTDTERLDDCLRAFVDYESPEVLTFRKAMDNFKADVPALLKVLREKIETASRENSPFCELRDKLCAHCQEYIRPNITSADIGEMLIQHILTCDIFRAVFDDPDFHRQHHLAKMVEHLQDALLGKMSRQGFLSGIEHYYKALRSVSDQVVDHSKQDFLKYIYEEFYKAYNPAAADTLGIVYTPSEIVRFMVQSADELLEQHFGRQISDKGVNILDPATGTGTFISEIISHMGGQSTKKLLHKYTNELHANEISLLAYYVAHLNITYTYKACTGSYQDFTGLCFVDSLRQDVDRKGKQTEAYTWISEENTRRVKEQNERNITLIIGNPPYNVGQQNANDNNPNPSYPAVDERIKDTFIKHSKAQKTKLYDMYVRFYRWAMDRLQDAGMLAFITNRSFLDARGFDGFRQEVSKDFDYAYILDLDGDVRARGKEAGGNVFNIMTGVAIMFLVKKKQKIGEKKQPCIIRYHAYDKTFSRQDKLRDLASSHWSALSDRPIDPDKNHNWLNLSDTDFETLLPLCNKQTKLAKNQDEQALFKLYSCGVVTARDPWVYDHDKRNLAKKMCYCIAEMKKLLASKDDSYPTNIKWSRDIKKKFHSAKWQLQDFDKNKVIKSTYRPFHTLYYYADKYWSDVLTANHSEIFGERGEHKNICLCFSGLSSAKGFQVLAVGTLPCFDFLEKTQCLPLYRYDGEGQRHDNLTAWGMAQLRTHYKDDSLTREQVFAYVYAVLHATAYRATYKTALTRHFPRVPYYAPFHALAERGQSLIDLHVDYEKTPRYALKRVDTPLPDPNPLLKIDDQAGTITIDEATTLRGVPKEAWNYTLGGRSALKWVVDQHREKKNETLPPELEHTPYRLAAHKETLIVLLERICTVACKTVRLVEKIDDLVNGQEKKQAIKPANRGFV